MKFEDNTEDRPLNCGWAVRIVWKYVYICGGYSAKKGLFCHEGKWALVYVSLESHDEMGEKIAIGKVVSTGPS